LFILSVLYVLDTFHLVYKRLSVPIKFAMAHLVIALFMLINLPAPSEVPLVLLIAWGAALTATVTIQSFVSVLEEICKQLLGFQL
jgi:hypothetical protein